MSLSKRIILVVIAFVVVAALALTFFLINREDSRPPITDTDTDSTSNNTPLAEVEKAKPVQPEPVATGTVITTGQSKFGTMLFNENKQAIYIWELEESSSAECYGNCAEAWPPVLTEGNPRATGEVNSNLLGTTKRSDGSTQVTYNGHPLYYYAHEGAGEVECHNVATHGGLWWVIQPNGNRAP